MLYMVPKVTGDNGEGNVFLEFFIGFTLKDGRQKSHQLNVIMEPLLREGLIWSENNLKSDFSLNEDWEITSIIALQSVIISLDQYVYFYLNPQAFNIKYKHFTFFFNILYFGKQTHWLDDFLIYHSASVVRRPLKRIIKRMNIHFWSQPTFQWHGCCTRVAILIPNLTVVKQNSPLSSRPLLPPTPPPPLEATEFLPIFLYSRLKL